MAHVMLPSQGRPGRPAHLAMLPRMGLSMLQASDSPSGKWAAIPREARQRGHWAVPHTPPLLVAPPTAVTHLPTALCNPLALSPPLRPLQGARLPFATQQGPHSSRSRTARLHHRARGPWSCSQKGHGRIYSFLSFLRPLGPSCALPHPEGRQEAQTIVGFSPQEWLVTRVLCASTPTHQRGLSQM